MKRILCVVVSAFLISVGVMAVEDLTDISYQPWRTKCAYRYNSFEDLKGVRKKFLKSIVQRMVDSAENKGFRHLGDRDDFDHCHLLIQNNTRVVRERDVFAALCHTQEQAYEYSRKAPGGPFDYIDREARNWIVWLDGRDQVENARKYRYSFTAPSQEWKDADEHYTIHSNMLDPEKMGYRQEHSEVQFNFPRVECPSVIREASNVIEVRVSTGERVCLSIENQRCHTSSRECDELCLKD